MTCPTAPATMRRRSISSPSSATSKRYCCNGCGITFKRTGTPHNFLEYPTDIVLLVVLWWLRYNLTLRVLSEMFLERGLVFTHEAVREREKRFAPLMSEELRKRRCGKRSSK